MIPCTIRSSKFVKALCELDASINFMPLKFYNNQDQGLPRNFDKNSHGGLHYEKSQGILCDVLEKVAFIIFLGCFIILDGEVDFDVSVILERIL